MCFKLEKISLEELQNDATNSEFFMFYFKFKKSMVNNSFVDNKHYIMNTAYS
jgi:hypothetical protein